MDFFLGGYSTPHPWHFFYAIYFALFFFAARFFLDRFVFRRFSGSLLNDGPARLRIEDAFKAKIAKCSESLWKMTYYTTAQICVLPIACGEAWFWNTKEYFTGWPDQALKLPLMLYYMGQCGFYIYSIGALLAWETRRKDFAVMMSHHVITVILIGYSYITKFFRVGTVILALHDASDVFLEGAKVFKYSGNELGASVCFGLFAVSWVLLRLIFFPFWIIRATSYYLVEHLELSKPYPRFLYYVFNTLLLMLVVFHAYWWCLIWSMISKQLKNRGRVGEDVRSDSDDDDEID